MAMMIAVVPAGWISAVVLVTLVLILGSSTMAFWLLTRRWTSHRKWVSLSEWARNRGFRLQSGDPTRVPAPLESLQPHGPVVRFFLVGGTKRVLQIQTGVVSPPGTQAATASPIASSMPGPSVPGSAGAAQYMIWNLMLQDLEGNWPPTGLRPSVTQQSALDLFSLSSFPRLGTTERFTVFGTDSTAAATLSRSMARSLLPPDVGLLLHGRQLMLDFSARPFDELELDRMIALAEQLSQRLPAVP